MKCASCILAVLAASSASSAFAAINANQEGLTGTWFNPATGGQGFQFQITPDTESPGMGSFFGAWFTFSDSSGSDDTQRWYSLQGAVPGDEDAIDVTIYQNIGGRFASPPSTTAVAVGTGSFTFDSCTSGTFTYSIGDSRGGSIPLSRLLPNVECSDASNSDVSASDFGLSGTWFDPAVGGQGMMIEINPGNLTSFIGWYTYAESDDSFDESGQRWFSAQGDFALDDTTFDVGIYETTGGEFNDDHPVETVQVGTATLTYTSCTTATFDYDFDAGALSGKSGTIDLERLGSVLDSCSFPTPN